MGHSGLSSSLVPTWGTATIAESGSTSYTTVLTLFAYLFMRIYLFVRDSWQRGRDRICCLLSGHRNWGSAKPVPRLHLLWGWQGSDQHLDHPLSQVHKSAKYKKDQLGSILTCWTTDPALFLTELKHEFLLLDECNSILLLLGLLMSCLWLCCEIQSQENLFLLFAIIYLGLQCALS